MADLEKTTATVRAYYQSLRILDFEATLATLSNDVIQQCPVGDPPNIGQEAVREFFQGMLGFFEAVAVTEKFLYATPDHAAAQWTCNGILQGGGRHITFEGIDIFVFNEDGLIKEITAYWDVSPLIGAVGV